MKRFRLLFAICIMFVVLVGGTFTLTGPTPVSPEDLKPTADILGEGMLDRMTFVGFIGTNKDPELSKDTFVFDKGLFLSAECERLCKFPARPYYARKKGDVIEFISETLCPYKDSKIVWRGTVQDGKVNGTSTWTSDRWYWSVEKKLIFEGELAEKTASIPVKSTAN